MEHKQGVFEEKKTAYWHGDKKEKGVILDAVVLVSGLARKAAIKRFGRMQRRSPYAPERRGRPRIYTTDVIAALREVWDIGNEACGENLHPMVGEYIDSQMQRKHWGHGAPATQNSAT